MKLKNLEVVLLPTSSTTGSKTAQEHDVTTTMRAESLTFNPPNIHSCHCGQIAPSLLYLFMRAAANFSQVWGWWFWNRGFFLGWTVTLVFQQLPVHGRLVLWWFMGCSWTSQPVSSYLRMTVWVFFQTSAKLWHIQITCTYILGSRRPSQVV